MYISKHRSDEGHAFQQRLGVDHFEDAEHANSTWITSLKVDPLHTFDEFGDPYLVSSPGPYLPRWQTSPVLYTNLVNEDLFLKLGVGDVANRSLQSQMAVLGGFLYGPPGTVANPDPTTDLFATLRGIWEGVPNYSYLGDPMSHLHIPIFDKFNTTVRKPVGIMKSLIHWRAYFRKILPPNIIGIRVVLENACDGFFTYNVRGDEAYAMGFGDQHESKFDYMKQTGTFNTNVLKDGTVTGLKVSQEGCPYSIHVYPSTEYYNTHINTQPVIISCSVAMVFVFTTFMFFVYDRLVERRQRLVLAKATQSTAIVSSLFPKNVRDRLLQTDIEKGKSGNTLPLAPNHRLKTFLNGNDNENETGAAPIADLFPNCTVFFGDIAGFTAWSSTRDPAQVFILLQAVYQAFDVLAKRRKVFKVETIGDSYVAVTGLPEPQPNHAVAMARFAWECLLKMGEIMRDLETTLGPDTGELSMRFGLHSGPVTAGVLRGDRARFQLFGDTVNTGTLNGNYDHPFPYLVFSRRLQHPEWKAPVFRVRSKSLNPRPNLLPMLANRIGSVHERMPLMQKAKASSTRSGLTWLATRRHPALLQAIMRSRKKLSTKKCRKIKCN